MPDITKIKIGNERERSYKDFPANREFKKRAEDDNSGGGGWPSDLPKPSIGGYGYTEQGEQVLFDGDLLIDIRSPADGVFYSIIDIDPLEVGETYNIVWNGVEYICECVAGEVAYIGNASIIGAPVETDEPFVFMVEEGVVLVVTSTSGTYSIKLSKNGDTIHKIDEKYLPASGGGAMVVVNCNMNPQTQEIELTDDAVEVLDKINEDFVSGIVYPVMAIVNVPYGDIVVTGGYNLCGYGINPSGFVLAFSTSAINTNEISNEISVVSVRFFHTDGEWAAKFANYIATN